MTWKLLELSKLDKTLIYKQTRYPSIPAPNVYIISYINFTLDCSYAYGETDAIRNNQKLLNSLTKSSQNIIADNEFANTYIIGPGNIFSLKYTKQIREVLINIPRNLFAVSPEYERIPYINSNLGETIRSPWGIVQSLSCCGIKKRVQNVLYEHLKEQIPFADEGIHLEHPPERIEDRINAIEQRHKALEFLLQDYVINVNILYDKDIDNRFYKHSKIKTNKLLKEEGLE
ncbi:hypothetical protein C2G38_2034149 [Gigaspora rosea]|uniref:Uncharacterized protein n=1 Tax=Gigaspora rosea TaxID=44941 RepID=A0A397VL17_9GLOM|nr:hypothetical protein C2G38_2034149 [Gigaspora rosea]